METRIQQLQNMHAYFESGDTRSYEFRRQQLIKLKEALYKFENEIYEALYLDLKKNKEEVWVTETGFVVTEINHALKNLHHWMKPKRVGTNLLNFPSKSYVLCEPLGVCLIIGPWNYPLQLLLTPLVGAMAAGNCAVLKPSEFAPGAAALIRKIVEENFDAHYITIIEGDGATVIPALLDKIKFDHIFYTGSSTVGSSIYQQAAKSLTPATLELGGKSPCIVEGDANIKIAAKRIALAKFSNAGQMCVAPDYVLLHQNVREYFLKELKKSINQFYNSDERRNYHYGKIVNKKQFDRLVAYLGNGEIVYGGKYDADSFFIEPTLLLNPPIDAPIMQGEIFGPLLPIITWQTEEDVYGVIKQHTNPLALYVFTSSNEKAEKWTRKISFGGGCINNASWHLTNPHLPFGGKGKSGMGNYHGKFSFETFSHKKALMKTPTWFDPSIKYPPYPGKLKWFKRIIK